MIAQHAFLREGFLQLFPAVLSVEIRWIDDLQTLLRSEDFGALADQHHMGGFRHHGMSCTDGVANRCDSSNRARPARGALHDRRFQFVATGVAEHGTLASVEQGRILHHHNRGNNGINAGAACLQDRVASGQRLCKRLHIRLLPFRCSLVPLHGSGATVNHQPDGWIICRSCIRFCCHEKQNRRVRKAKIVIPSGLFVNLPADSASEDGSAMMPAYTVRILCLRGRVLCHRLSDL